MQYTCKSSRPPRIAVQRLLSSNVEAPSTVLRLIQGISGSDMLSRAASSFKATFLTQRATSATSAASFLMNDLTFTLIGRWQKSAAHLETRVVVRMHIPCQPQLIALLLFGADNEIPRLHRHIELASRLLHFRVMAVYYAYPFSAHKLLTVCAHLQTRLPGSHHFSYKSSPRDGRRSLMMRPRSTARLPSRTRSTRIANTVCCTPLSNADCCTPRQGLRAGDYTRLYCTAFSTCAC